MGVSIVFTIKFPLRVPPDNGKNIVWVCVIVLDSSVLNVFYIEIMFVSSVVCLPYKVVNYPYITPIFVSSTVYLP